MNKIQILGRVNKEVEIRDFGTPKERAVFLLRWDQGIAIVSTFNVDTLYDIEQNTEVLVEGKLVVTNKKVGDTYKTSVCIFADKVTVAECPVVYGKNKEPDRKKSTEFSSLTKRLLTVMTAADLAEKCHVSGPEVVFGWTKDTLPNLPSRFALRELEKQL